MLTIDHLIWYIGTIRKVGDKVEPLLRYFKKADKEKNRIIIPKCIIEKYGREYYIELMPDGTIKLTPVKKGE